MTNTVLTQKAEAAAYEVFPRQKYLVSVTPIEYNGVCVRVKEIVRGERVYNVSRDGGKTFKQEYSSTVEYFPVSFGGVNLYGVENPDGFKRKIRKHYDKFI